MTGAQKALLVLVITFLAGVLTGAIVVSIDVSWAR